MTPTQIKKILANHAKWRADPNTGARADLSGAKLTGADLSRAYLYGANMAGANLYGANLSGANLSGAYLSGAYLYGANMAGANLYGAYLSSANMYGANMAGANLYGANLSGAYLSGANLSGANLSGAYLSRADLSRADLSRANLPSPTMVLLAQWGDLPDALTTLAMAYDAACHPDPAAFTAWAEGGACPYAGRRIERACNFTQRKELWRPDVAAPRPYDLMVAILAAKCPDWADQQRAEFDAQFGAKEQGK